MKYIVVFDYCDYVFDDANEAMKFAETAKRSFMPNSYNKDISIKIKVISVEEFNSMKEDNDNE